MILGEAVKTGLREIRTHAFRSVLTFSAIAVGVASILYTFAQTHGMRAKLNQAITLMGPGRMTIHSKPNYISRGLSPGLTWGDAQTIRLSMPELAMVYPKVRRGGSKLYFNAEKVEDVPIQGTTEEWSRRDWVYTMRGRFINSWDVRNAARVCVVIAPGGWFKKPFWATWWNEDPLDLFLARHDLLGKQIRLENRQFTVVGVLQEPPKDLDPRWFHWEDNPVLIPITTYHLNFKSNNWGNPKSRDPIEQIEVDTGREETVISAKHRIETILKQRHRGEEDYEIQDNRGMIEEQLSETKRYIFVGIVLGMVALLAGGIGIMNVTLAAMFSRIREIGIRRALGATRADILAQFMTESMFLGLWGGLAGVGLGYAGVAYLARESTRDLANLTWYHMIAVVLIGVTISCLFSLYPARQAAALDPVTALKDE